MSRNRRYGLLVFLFGIGCAATVFAQSGLLPIYQCDIPYYIEESGSYVVAEPLAGTNPLQSAIYVWADNVTIDLSGNPVEGTFFAAAIYQSASNHNLAVKNGTVMRGIDADGSGNRFENLTFHLGLGDVLATGPGSVVDHCLFASNEVISSGALIHVGDGSRVTDCSLVYNTGEGTFRGIRGGNGVTVERCVLEDGIYGSNTVSVMAMDLGDGCVVDGITVNNFHAKHWTNSYALKAGNNTLVSDCQLAGPIQVGDGSLVAHCDVHNHVRDFVPDLYFFSSVGNGSVVVENLFDGTEVADASLTVNDGSLVRDNYSKDALVAGNGSLVVRNEFYGERVTASYDCFILNNHILSGVVLEHCCNRVDNNYMTAYYLGGTGTAYSVQAYAGDDLVVRNRFKRDGSYFIYGGSDDHVGMQVDQTDITSDQVWANLQSD